MGILRVRRWMIQAAGLCLLFSSSRLVWAKTSVPLYQDPFDIAAGGASLTRASTDGRLYANPALLGLGPGFNRWSGFGLGVFTSDSVRQLGAEVMQHSSNAKAIGLKAEDTLLNTPVHAGFQVNTSWVNRLFGYSFLSRNELDMRLHDVGDKVALPSFRANIDSYTGLTVGAAIPTALSWLKFGIDGRLFFAEATPATIDPFDQSNGGVQKQIAKQEATFVNQFKNFSQLPLGFGLDAGALLFFQGYNVDWSFAGKLDDLGTNALSPLASKALSGGAKKPAGAASAPALPYYPEVTSLGAGLTLHSADEALHLAADVRDVGGATGDRLFKRVYAGAKLLLDSHIGVAGGLYQGQPSFGAEVDFFVARLAFTHYTEELGDYPGADPRTISMVTFEIGF